MRSRPPWRMTLPVNRLLVSKASWPAPVLVMLAVPEMIAVMMLEAPPTALMVASFRNVRPMGSVPPWLDGARVRVLPATWLVMAPPVMPERKSEPPAVVELLPMVRSIVEPVMRKMAPMLVLPTGGALKLKPMAETVPAAPNMATSALPGVPALFVQLPAVSQAEPAPLPGPDPEPLHPKTAARAVGGVRARRARRARRASVSREWKMGLFIECLEWAVVGVDLKCCGCAAAADGWCVPRAGNHEDGGTQRVPPGRGCSTTLWTSDSRGIGVAYLKPFLNKAQVNSMAK